MTPSDIKVLLARLLGLGAVFCGAIGLLAGLLQREWRLGVFGWFTGGILLAFLALLLLLDTYVTLRRQRIL